MTRDASAARKPTGKTVPSAIGTSPKMSPGCRSPTTRSIPSTSLTGSMRPSSTANSARSPPSCAAYSPPTRLMSAATRESCWRCSTSSDANSGTAPISSVVTTTGNRTGCGGSSRSSRGSAQEAPQRDEQLLRRLLGDEVAGRQRTALDRVGPLPPDEQRTVRKRALLGAPVSEDRAADLSPGFAIVGVHRPVDVERGTVVGADRRDHVRGERSAVALRGLRRDRGGRRGERVERVAEEVLRARADEALGERRWLGQEEPRVVVDRGVPRHALELIDGRDDVEHAQAIDDRRMVERHAVRDAAAAVVADDREAIEAEPRHQLDELGRHLALAVALAERAAGSGAALAVALQVADDDGVLRGQLGSDAVPGVVRLREAVQQQDGRPRAGDPGPVARRPDLDRRVAEALDPGRERISHRANPRPEEARRQPALPHAVAGPLDAVRRRARAGADDLLQLAPREHQRGAVVGRVAAGELTAADEAPEHGAALLVAVVVRAGAADEQGQTVVQRSQPRDVERVRDRLLEP